MTKNNSIMSMNFISGSSPRPSETQSTTTGRWWRRTRPWCPTLEMKQSSATTSPELPSAEFFSWCCIIFGFFLKGTIKIATTQVGHLFIKLLLHLSHVKQMYSQPILCGFKDNYITIDTLRLCVPNVYFNWTFEVWVIHTQNEISWIYHLKETTFPQDLIFNEMMK